MDKRIILAVAGSGKTYRLCKEIDPLKKNIIIAYTNQNIKNIRNELMKNFNNVIPQYTKIYTFHSFIYTFLIRPYEPLISKHFQKKPYRSIGVSLEEPPEQRIKNKFNPKYIKDNKFEHYCINKKYYCNYMSKLIVKVKKNKEYNLLKNAMKNINCFFDNIYIDEFQDFRENDFELLKNIIKNCNNILLAGDFYQHSVNAKSNHGKPYQKNKTYIQYEDCIKILEDIGLKVDTKTLKKTRRCPQNICEFINKKLNINIEADNKYAGQVIFLNNLDDIIKTIENDKIKKLVQKNAIKYSFNAINWSYSKGDTYDDSCIILTKQLKDIDIKDNINNIITPISLNCLYVALSRTKGNLYIVKNEYFEQIKKLYIVS